MSITIQVNPASDRRFIRWLTDVLLIVNLEERKNIDGTYNETCEALDNINDWFVKMGHADLDVLSQGIQSAGYMLQCDVYGGAFNLLKIDEFVLLVLSQKWKRPDSVMLLIKDEEQAVFTVHKTSKPAA